MRVLVVDDDQVTLKCLQALLEGDSIDTVGVTSGRDAIEALGRETFDAVVTDFLMPDVSGAEVIGVARRTQPGTAVIVVSGSVGASEAIAAGADRMLDKPVDYCELTEALYDLTKTPYAETRTFRLLVENVREVFWMTTPRKDRMLYVSPAYEEIWGRTRRSLYERPSSWLDAVHPEDRPLIAAAASHQAAAPYDVTYRINRPDGSQRWIRDHGFPVRREDGTVDRIVGAAEDITDLRKTEQQLLQAQKMEAIGRLAGGIAHDFNNVLSVILAYAEMVAGDLGASSPLRPEMDEIRNAASRAAALTRQLLLFSRQEVSQPKVVDLNQVIGGMEQMLRRILLEDITLTVLPGSRWNVKVDPGHIEQVIMNLVVNARDALPHGGQVTIATSDVEVDASFAQTHPPLRPGSFVLLTVTDDGAGMDAATVAHIFEPFYTTKEAGKGTGLGLSTVFGIVSQSNGCVLVESEPRKGSTFRVYLPRAAEAPSRSLSPVPFQVARAKAKGVILLVEDEEQVRRATTAILRRAGYEVVATPNAKEALAAFDARGGKFDLLVTDMIMPGKNGFELAREVSRREPSLKVLIVSGYSGNHLARHDLVAEQFPVVQKPFSRETLLGAVSDALER